jgi:hypothetical protein
MDPITIAALGLGAASLVGTVLGANAQASAIKANAEFQAKIAELNAQMAEIDAANVRRQARALEARSLTETAVVQDEQQAAFAAQGVEVKDDATGDLLAQSGLNAALNRMDIQNQAFFAESRLRNEATQRRIGAQVGLVNAEAGARSALFSGYVSALGQGANLGLNASRAMGKIEGPTPSMGSTSAGGFGSGVSLSPEAPRTALGNNIFLFLASDFYRTIFSIKNNTFIIFT